MNLPAIIDQPQVPSFSFGDISRIADAFAKSRMFGVSDPAQALTLCLLAQAEGQHPAAAFRDYSIIQGKPAKKAEAMLRDFLTSGGKVKWLQLTDECAEATFSHPAGGEATINWTLARASKAGMGGKDMWKKYPRQMLRARVVSEGVRTVCPMATSGLYVPEEAQDFAPDPTPTHDASTGEPIDAAPVEQKVTGIHKIKQAIRQMKAEGNEAVGPAEFETVIGKYVGEMQALEDANHNWWTGHDSDGNTFESLPEWVERRRAELAPQATTAERMAALANEPEEDGQFKMLVDSLKECGTLQSLTNWMAANEAIVEMLDGEESRKFQLAYELHESAVLAVANVTAG